MSHGEAGDPYIGPDPLPVADYKVYVIDSMGRTYLESQGSADLIWYDNMTTVYNLTSRTPMWPVRVSGYFTVHTGDMGGNPQPFFGDVRLHPNTDSFVANPFGSVTTGFPITGGSGYTSGSYYVNEFISALIPEPAYTNAALHLIAANI